MSCRSLQVIGNGVVVLVTKIVTDDLRDDRCHAAELCVAECIPSSSLCQESAVFVGGAFTDNNDAILVFLDALLNASQKRAFVERYLGEQNNVWRVFGGVACKTSGSGNPAGVTPHDLENENLG